MTTTAVIRVSEPGAPEVLRYEREELGSPTRLQVRLRQAAIGVNGIDLQLRSGREQAKQLPFVPGIEGAGVIEEVGAGVRGLQPGDRVAYHRVQGAYAAQRLVSSLYLVPLPPDISFELAAAILTKGLTARMLVKQVFPLAEGDVVLIHGAAGAVGTLLARWAVALGATVIGTVSSEAKRIAAEQSGIQHVIVTEHEDFVARVRQIVGNDGVDVLYDGVGEATFNRSLPLITRFGKAVLYGSASGFPKAADQATVSARVISVAVPTLAEHIPDRTTLDYAAADLFAAVQAGIFGDLPMQRYALAQAAQAHADIEARRTIGPVLLVPQEADYEIMET